MTDYISREAALKKQIIITERYHAQGADEEYGHEVVQSEDIRAIPAADVKPVVRGEWVVETCNDGFCEYELYHCSRCDEISPRPRNFCHNCGADMRKEASDER